MSAEYDAGLRLMFLRICGVSLMHFIAVGAVAAALLLLASVAGPGGSTLRTLGLIAVPLAAVISILRSAVITTVFMMKRARGKSA